MPITCRSCSIRDVLVVEPVVNVDARGGFFEAWNDRDFRNALGDHDPFVQDNQSRSSRGVMRGLHYQLPNPQGKLVRVIAGDAFVVAVDIRRSSPTFGRWVSERISADNLRQLWIPPGFAHGFIALSDSTEMLYKVTAFYVPGHDRAILWNDPDIGIDWPDPGVDLIISDKDRTASPLSQSVVFD